jgi:hypothetical protein
MATLKEAAELTSELTELTQELHSELTEGDVDFDRMIELADQISEQADGLASAFSTVNEALAQRITDVKQGGDGRSSQGGGGKNDGDESGQESRSGQRKGGSKRAEKAGDKS